MAKSASVPPPEIPLSDLYLAIVDSSEDGIISKKLDGTVTSWNASAERIFGYTAEEMIGRSILTVIPLERRSEETLILGQISRGERIAHFDTQRVTKSGTLVDVSLTISPIKNAEGIIVGASKVVRDITNRRQTEQLLRSQQSKLEIVNQVGAALSGEHDLQKLVQAATDAGRTLSGAAFGAFFYNVSNDKGESYMLYTLSGAPREAFEKFGMPRNTPVFAATFSGEGIVRVDDITQDPRYGTMPPHHGMPEGHLPVRSYLAVPVVSRTGEVVGGLFFGHPEPGVFTQESETLLGAVAAHAAVAIDNSRLYEALQKEIQTQREMELALRESEELSSKVLNASADCVKVLDLEGRIVSMNIPGLRLFGLKDLEPIRLKYWPLLWPEESREMVRSSMQEAATGKTVHFEGICPNSEGLAKWWDVLITPLLDAEGRVTRLTATSRDVTEQRRTAEKISAAAAEAERQSRMKDEFLSTLSHELRTPLQSILGWIQILQSEDRTEEDLTQGLEVIDRNAQAQTRIIEDLLDMSRILSGKVRLDVQPVELSPVIEATLDTVRPSAQAKNIRLQAVLDPMVKPVAGDPSRLQQILWNLLSNAIKFTPSGGRVQVLLERVNSHIEVSVADTGQGISPEFLPYVFERFRQGDAATTRRHGGLGLGLAIAKHLAELHGGSIRVKSPGEAKGTTFTVMLPLAAIHIPSEESSRRHPTAPEQVATTPKPQAPSLRGISVLVVDDEPDAQAVLAKILSNAGATVRTASSARDALTSLKDRVPDVLVSDIGMPVEDGYHLIRTVRALPPTEGGRTPAIALTAYTRTEDRIKAISHGFQMHLSKPADSLELLTLVASLSGKKA